MKWLRVSWIMAAVSLGCVASLNAQESTSSSPASVVRLQRDATYEQYLHFQASADTAITPARVLRWINSLMGNTTVGKPSNIEFQPVLQVHDYQRQIVAQVAYKF